MLGLKTSDFLHFLFLTHKQTTTPFTIPMQSHLYSVMRCFLDSIGHISPESMLRNMPLMPVSGPNCSAAEGAGAAGVPTTSGFWSSMSDDCEGTVMPAAGADADVGALLLLPEEEEEDSGAAAEEEEEAEVNHS